MTALLQSKCGQMAFRGLFLIALLSAALAGGCRPALEPSPLPTPAALEVQITPALQAMGDRFRNCALELPNTGLVLLKTPADSIDLERTEIALRWGAGSAAFEYAAVIGEESLVIVTHPENPLQEISLDDLRAMYTGGLREWPEPAGSGEIEPWAYPAGDDVQEVFEKVVLGEPLAAGATWLAPDPGAMREAVSGSRAAVGFLPQSWLDESVKPLAVTGIAAERLRQPLLALSKLEPTGPEKAWLICLQQAPR